MTSNWWEEIPERDGIWYESVEDKERVTAQVANAKRIVYGWRTAPMSHIERMAVWLYYFVGMKWEEVGTELEITKQGAHKAGVRGVEKIGRYLREKKGVG